MLEWRLIAFIEINVFFSFTVSFSESTAQERMRGIKMYL